MQYCASIKKNFSSRVFYKLSAAVVAASIFCAAPTAQAACRYKETIASKDLPIGVVLTWSTATEENNAMFVIEKSDNGMDYTNIGTVRGAGTSLDGQEYNFLDPAASNSRLFYRLKQTDFDGTYNYSEIVAVSKKIPNQFMVVKMSGATTTNSFVATIDAFKSVELTYTLKDLQNTPILSRKMPLKNGYNELTVDLAGMRPAHYKLVMTVGKEEEMIVIERIASEMEKKPATASRNK